MAEATIRVLGPVEVCLEGREVTLGATKQRALLAMLALSANSVVSADRLMEGLWGEHPPPSAAKMVQLYVSQLRKLLSGADGAEIVTQGRGYELRVSAGVVDAMTAEALLREPSQARAAAALFRGPPLADVADEPFAAEEIRRLDELRTRAVLAALEGDVAAGRHDAALPEIEALLAEQPFSERLHELTNTSASSPRASTPVLGQPASPSSPESSPTGRRDRRPDRPQSRRGPGYIALPRRPRDHPQRQLTDFMVASRRSVDRIAATFSASRYRRGRGSVHERAPDA